MQNTRQWQAHMGEHDNGLHLLGTIDVPIFLLKLSDGWALIEGSVEPLAPLILRQLKSIVSDLGLIKHWFITHSHYDHIGTVPLLLPWLPNAKVYASALTKKALRNPKANEVTYKLTQSLYRIMPEAERPDDELEQHRMALADIPVTVLEEGDEVHFDADHSMVALATPGHAKCLLSFYEPQYKRLYVSDTLGEMVSPSQWEPLIFQDYPAYIASLVKLQGLAIEQLVLGHHGVLYGALAQDAPKLAEQGVYRFIEQAKHVYSELAQDAQKTAQHISELTRDSTGTFVSKKLHYNGTLLMLTLLGVVPHPELVE
ncbi:MBL fold metallo-hydrolase [Pseudoalteromonas sp. JBTF-M23]|uniref:MBL fold metallo-hydrolase n=1 Tax=Pseudoalteromonas caenipelagi TaxID=2726988 RepID=A0A849VEY1_9GAMM|nr:MBL fold metallo-hydrolase [Pseudoalteromonas caenipelagi]NOU51360.1 MBL fold metallo-hydrolase [Pseudoalteromonas caenipelagi]